MDAVLNWPRRVKPSRPRPTGGRRAAGGRVAILLLILLSICLPARAALSVVQAQSAETVSGSTSTTQSVNINTTAGNLLVAFIRQGSDNTSTVTVSDSASQTWTQVSSSPVHSSQTNFTGYMFYIPNSAAVASVTVTFSVAVKNRSITVYEISGAATSSPLDGNVSSSTSVAATSLTSGSLTTTNANDILLYGVSPDGASGGFTVGSGFTFQTNSNTNTREAMQYEIVSSVQTNVTTSMSWATSQTGAVGIFAAFKAASGGPPPCGNFIALMGAGCK